MSVVEFTASPRQRGFPTCCADEPGLLLRPGLNDHTGVGR